MENTIHNPELNQFSLTDDEITVETVVDSTLSNEPHQVNKLGSEENSQNAQNYQKN